MSAIASQITSLTIVYSTVYSGADQRKHQSSASLAFVWGIHRDRWIPRTKGQLRGKCFHLMTSSCGLCVSIDFFIAISFPWWLVSSTETCVCLRLVVRFTVTTLQELLNMRHMQLWNTQIWFNNSFDFTYKYYDITCTWYFGMYGEINIIAISIKS